MNEPMNVSSSPGTTERDSSIRDTRNVSPPPGRTEPDPRTARDARIGSTRESIPDLVKQVAEDVSTLLSKEISLAKAELREAASQAKAGVTSMAGGFGMVFAGLLYVLMAAVLGLALVMSAWLAALVVGVVTLVIGMIMVSAGKKKVEPEAFVPDRTMDSIRKDKDMTKRAAS